MDRSGLKWSLQVCFPEPFTHVSRCVSSLLGGLSVQEVAQLFDIFRGKPLTRAGVERALECYIIVKRTKEHGFTQITLQWETPPGMVMVPRTGATVTPSGMVMPLRPWVTVTPLSDEKNTPIKRRDILS